MSSQRQQNPEQSSEQSSEQRPGRCRLCLEEQELLKPHILSEFLYQSTYQYFDPDNPKKKRMIEIPSDVSVKPSYPQKGFREKLLCEACEQHLNQIGERYAAKVLKTMDETEIPAGDRYAIVRNVDYASFKLFLMMQIWRADIASGPDWRAVDLGSHRETIRKMLLAARPGRPCEYACSVTRIPDSSGPLARAVVRPATAKYQGHRLYEFTARGYSWMYIVSSHSKEPFVPEFHLSENGDLPILADSTGSIDLRANEMIQQLQHQRRVRNRVREGEGA